MEKSQELYLEGRRSLQKGEIQAAIQKLNEAHTLAPRSAPILCELGQALYKQGQKKAASKALKQALSMDKSQADAHEILAAIYQEDKDDYQVIPHLRALEKLRPSESRHLYGLARSLARVQQYTESVAYYDRYLSLYPNSPRVQFEYAQILPWVHQTDKAIAIAKDGLQKAPKSVQGYRCLGELLVNNGHFEEAEALLTQWIASNPLHGTLWVLLSSCRRFKEEDRPLLKQIQTCIDQPADSSSRRNAYFAQAKILLDLGEKEQAFESYRKGNEETQTDFNFTDYEKYIKASQKVFTPQLFQKMKGYGSDSELPIFIFGMPRSGTSLIEQIIASHSKAAGGGELYEISEIARTLKSRIGAINTHPLCIPKLQAAQSKAIARQHLQWLQKFAPKAQRITDKMPGNFCFLGLIALLFPRARLIHCRRDPMDTALSCYFQNFSENVKYSKDLEHLARYYVGYQRLMEFWKKVLPIPILEIDYEALVQSPKEHIEKILEFCGLEWEDACLNFHKNRRTVQTASNWQVRQPLYTKSVGRWRDFERQLQPFIEGISITGNAKPQSHKGVNHA